MTESDLPQEQHLHLTWVKIYGVPPKANTERSVKYLAEVVGEPIEVDGKSLIREGAARVKVNCRMPSLINQKVEIFVNKIGYQLFFESEDLNSERKRLLTLI